MIIYIIVLYFSLFVEMKNQHYVSIPDKPKDAGQVTMSPPSTPGVVYSDPLKRTPTAHRRKGRRWRCTGERTAAKALISHPLITRNAFPHGFNTHGPLVFSTLRHPFNRDTCIGASQTKCGDTAYRPPHIRL